MTHRNITKGMFANLGMLVMVLLFSSCGGDAELGSHVPKDAAGVLVVNNSQLITKLAMDQMNMDNFKGLMNMESSDDSGNSGDDAPMSDRKKWSKAMSSPGDVGIDYFADAYAYVGKINNSEPSSVVLLIELSDKGKFESFLDNNPPNDLEATTEKGNGYSYRALGEMTLGWNDNMIAVVMVNPSSSISPEKTLANVFNLDASESIAKDDRFKDLLDEGSDFGFYVDIQSIMEEVPQSDENPLLAMQWAEHANFFLSFNDGEIDLKSVQYNKSDKKEVVEKLTGEVMLTELFDKFKVDESMGFMNVRYDINMIKEALAEDQGAQNDLMRELEAMQMSEDEFYSLFKGDLMVAVTGVEMVEQEITTYEMDENFNRNEVKKMVEAPAPQFLAAMTTDADNMKKVLEEMMKNERIIEAKDGNYQVNPELSEGMPIYLKLEDDQLKLVSNLSMLDESVSNSGATYDLATNKPMSGYINLETILKEMPPQNMMMMMAKPVTDKLKGFEIYVEPNGGDMMTSHFVIKFLDQDTNGLSQVIKLSNEAKQRLMGMGMPM